MGHVTYLLPKGKGDHSMSRKRSAAERTYKAGLQDPRAMVKARLLEIQFPAVYEFARRHSVRNDDAILVQAFSGGVMNTSTVWARDNESWQGNEWITYSVLNVPNRRNTGSPTGHEPHGDGASIVVVSVTPHQGRRESRLQGEGKQVVQTNGTARYS